jgi:hypothetical protein
VDRVLAVCFPASDIGFGERVRNVVAQKPWDLRSPEGQALLQTILRESYPYATVAPAATTLDGGWHPPVLVHVYRDGDTGPTRRREHEDRITISPRRRR